MGQLKHHFFVCQNNRPPGHPKGSCAERGSFDVMDALYQHIEEKELWGKVKVTGTACLGPCDRGAVAVVYPEGVWYSIQSTDDVDEIMTKHVEQGSPVERIRFDPESM
ncbi:MAG: (2Fe-2S) ferredoxin domain-containing protein [SAR324 cluster bacterium]|nr:(2Fe-2S) ferredoxin domain-containing protein [SAR324 cluster bacterium]